MCLWKQFELPYRAKYALNDEVSCRHCLDTIKKGDLGMAALGDCQEEEGVRLKKWYHAKCFSKLLQLREEDTNERTTKEVAIDDDSKADAELAQLREEASKETKAEEGLSLELGPLISSKGPIALKSLKKKEANHDNIKIATTIDACKKRSTRESLREESGSTMTPKAYLFPGRQPPGPGTCQASESTPRANMEGQKVCKESNPKAKVQGNTYR